MQERPIEISQTYTPGKAFGNTRTITIDRIPATELILDGETEIALDRLVCERLEKLRARALRASDAQDQRITYTASDSRTAAALGGTQASGPWGSVRSGK